MNETALRVLAPEFEGLDVAKLLRTCVIHDLGEASRGDISAIFDAETRAHAERSGAAERRP
jgi:5'-deoxynucleotidase YfbR-like HD superfamily hydrolase